MSEPKAATTTDNEQNQDEPEFIQKLREKARRADELERQLEERTRLDAFREAGVDPSKDPKMNYFIKGYEGDVDPKAIKAKAIEDGFLTDTEQASKDTELAGHDAIADDTSVPVSVPGDDLAQRIRQAKPEEVMAILAETDPRFIAPVE